MGHQNAYCNNTDRGKTNVAWSTIALDSLGIVLFLLLLAASCFNSYNYGFKKKIYAVPSMTAMYIAIYCMICARIAYLSETFNH